MTHGDTPVSLRCCFFSSECPARAPALSLCGLSLARVSGRTVSRGALLSGRRAGGAAHTRRIRFSRILFAYRMYV